MTQAQKHEFKVHDNILVQLIKRQAGTLGKALLELHMNSVDAGCISTSLEITQDGFVFEDNGKGFANEQEIHDLFGCVGWPHEEGSRVYGEFGLGRLQILNFASTDWLTNGMQMSVDINTKGLSYEVLHGTNEVKGLRIEGKFFKKLELRELVNVISEFKTAVKYSPVPVTLNSERIDTDRSKVKWTFETEEAYILIKDTLRDISVYNQGVYVRDYPSSHFGGSGGVVVTKHGVRLVLNTARNDIITQDCKAWAKIKPFLMDQAKKERKKSVSYKEDNIRFMRSEFDSGEDFEPFFTGKFIKDIQGRTHSMKSISDRYWYRTGVALGESKNRALVTAHEAKDLFVFDRNCVALLGCDTVEEFRDLISMAKARFEPSGRSSFDRVDVIKDTLAYEQKYKSQYEFIAHDDQTKLEQLFLASLKHCANTIAHAGGRFGTETIEAPRNLVLGSAVGMLAWTDGKNYIALDRDYLNKQFKLGYAGFLNVCSTLAHEYCHPDSSSDADVHDHGLDFYERFHNLILSEGYSKFLAITAVYHYGEMVKKAVKAGIKLNKTHTDSELYLSRMENECSKQAA